MTKPPVTISPRHFHPQTDRHSHYQGRSFFIPHPLGVLSVVKLATGPDLSPKNRVGAIANIGAYYEAAPGIPTRESALLVEGTAPLLGEIAAGRLQVSAREWTENSLSQPGWCCELNLAK